MLVLLVHEDAPWFVPVDTTLKVPLPLSKFSEIKLVVPLGTNKLLELPKQIVAGEAVTEGTGVIAFIVSVLEDVSGAVHGDVAIAVKVNLTDPAVISAGLGLYVAKVNELAFANVPVPLDVHTTVL